MANAAKTTFMMFRLKSRNDRDFSIRVDGAVVQESRSERILGFQVERSLDWGDHVKKVISRVNHGLATLRNLQGLLRKNSLRSLAEGLVISHIRYGMSIYMSSAIKMRAEDPTNKFLQKLQVKQNDAMRMILNKRRKDQTSREDLLRQSNMRSINQMAAENVVMELWRAFRYRIDSITNAYIANKSTRFGTNFRTSSNVRSFISVSAELFNKQCDDLKSIETTANSARRWVRKMITENLPKF